MDNDKRYQIEILSIIQEKKNKTHQINLEALLSV